MYSSKLSHCEQDLFNHFRLSVNLIPVPSSMGLPYHYSHRETFVKSALRLLHGVQTLALGSYCWLWKEEVTSQVKRKKTLEASSSRSCRVSAAPSPSGSITAALRTPCCALQATRRHPVAIQVPPASPGWSKAPGTGRDALQAESRMLRALWCSWKARLEKFCYLPKKPPREAQAAGCGWGRLLPASSCATALLPQRAFCWQQG